MKITKFEENKAWQEARVLTKIVSKITSEKKNDIAKDFGLKDQIQRSVVSIMANIAEGFDTQSDVEFIKFLNYSRRSCSELQSYFYIALDNKYISQHDFDNIYDKIVEIKSLIGDFVCYLKSKT